MPDDALPASLSPSGLVLPESLLVAQMPLSLQIFFHDALYERVKQVAQVIAKSGLIRHLRDRPEACFAVVSQALVWRLDPFRVAMSTFETPDGRIGYHGMLIRAILEMSGRLKGGIEYDHYGDWEKVTGRFKMVESKKPDRTTGEPRFYPVPAWDQWTVKDEGGLGVHLTTQIVGEEKPRKPFEFTLLQAFPRFSTLWATDPKMQLIYTSTRRFASTSLPHLFMGVPFERGEVEEWADTLRDVTPPARPVIADYVRRQEEERELTGAGTEPLVGTGQGGPQSRRKKGAPAAAEELAARQAAEEKPAAAAEDGETKDDAGAPVWAVLDEAGEPHHWPDMNAAVVGYAEMIEKSPDQKTREARWENGADLRQAIRQANAHAANALDQQYELLRNPPKGDGPADPPRGGNGSSSSGAASASTTASPPGPSARAAATGKPAPAPAEKPAYLVPRVQGMKPDDWYAAARYRLKQMHEARDPPAAFTAYREQNKPQLDWLQDELPKWQKMLEDRIASGEQGKYV